LEFINEGETWLADENRHGGTAADGGDATKRRGQYIADAFPLSDKERARFSGEKKPRTKPMPLA
jgi:hypothetical protein